MIRLKIKHSICKYEAARRWNCFFEPPDKDWSVKILLKTGTKCLLSEVTDSLCPKLKWSWVCLFIQWGHSDSAGEREGCDGLWCDKQIAIALLSFYKFSRLENKPIKQKKNPTKQTPLLLQYIVKHFNLSGLLPLPLAWNFYGPSKPNLSWPYRKPTLYNIEARIFIPACQKRS